MLTPEKSAICFRQYISKVAQHLWIFFILILMSSGSIAEVLSPLDSPRWSIKWSGNVHATLSLTNNSVYIAGEFSSVNDTPVKNIARLKNAGAELDTNWNVSVNGTVYAMALGPNNGIFVAGNFNSVNGVDRKNFALITESGEVHPDWDIRPSSTVFSLEVSGDSLYLGGAFQSVTAPNGTGSPYLARLNSISTSPELDLLWSSSHVFNESNIQTRIYSIKVVGDFVYAGGLLKIKNQSSALEHINLTKIAVSTGLLDTGFNLNPDASVLALAADSGGLVVGGMFKIIGGQYRDYLGRVLNNGSLASWNPVVSDIVRALKYDNSGKLWVGGDFDQINGVARSKLARFSSSLILDATSLPEIDGVVNDISSYPITSRLAVGGNFTTPDRMSFLRINSNAELLSSLDAENIGEVNSLVFTADNRWYIGGAFKKVDGVRVDNLARTEPQETRIDSSWKPNPSGVVSSLIENNLKLYVGGQFEAISEQPRRHLARFDNGQLDNWSPNPNAKINAFALDVNGDFYVGGGFTEIDGTSQKYIARFNSDGVMNASFSPSQGREVVSLAVDGSHVYAGRLLQTGLTDSLRRFHKAFGILDTSWDPSLYFGIARAIALDELGGVYVGGNFTSSGIHGSARGYLTKFTKTNPDASLTWLGSGFGANGEVRSLSADTQGGLFVAGSFKRIGGEDRAGLARLIQVGGTAAALDTEWVPKLQYSPSPQGNRSPYIYTMVVKEDQVVVGGAFDGAQTLMGSVEMSSTAAFPSPTQRHYILGGTVYGLAGSGLSITTNGQTLAISNNGKFNFPVHLNSGDEYNVVVVQQPSNPTQQCGVENNTGVVGDSDISEVEIHCETMRYPLGGSVLGLSGSGLVVATNGQTLSINQNGNFVFPEAIESGTSYDVTVVHQPSSPTQLCFVTRGAGVVGSSEITNVQIVCNIERFTLGGSVTGLVGSGLTLVSPSQSILISSNGQFEFPESLYSGNIYDVRVVQQPQFPWQTCSVSQGTGIIEGADITNVHVSCATNRYALGGQVSGLEGSGLVISNQTENLSVNANGAFQFESYISSGADYSVSIKSLPDNPRQQCVIDNGVGTVHGAAIDNVSIQCATITHAVSLVSGENGQVSLAAGQSFTADAVPEGVTIAVLIQPAAGYVLDELFNTCGGALQAGVLTTLPILGPCEISATFKLTQTQSDLQISIDSDASYVMPGESLVFKVVVFNVGPDSQFGARLQATKSLGFLEMDWICVDESSSALCPDIGFGTGDVDVLVNLPPGKYLEFAFVGTVDYSVGSSLVQSISISPSEGSSDENLSNNTAELEVLVGKLLFEDGFERLKYH